MFIIFAKNYLPLNQWTGDSLTKITFEGTLGGALIIEMLDSGLIPCFVLWILPT